MRNGGAACKLPVPVPVPVPRKEASPEHQPNPDFINPTHFLARTNDTLPSSGTVPACLEW